MDNKDNTMTVVMDEVVPEMSEWQKSMLRDMYNFHKTGDIVIVQYPFRHGKSILDKAYREISAKLSS
jgi:hypothetical protein